MTTKKVHTILDYFSRSAIFIHTKVGWCWRRPFVVMGFGKTERSSGLLELDINCGIPFDKQIRHLKAWQQCHKSGDKRRETSIIRPPKLLTKRKELKETGGVKGWNRSMGGPGSVSAVRAVETGRRVSGEAQTGPDKCSLKQKPTHTQRYIQGQRATLLKCV